MHDQRIVNTRPLTPPPTSPKLHNKITSILSHSIRFVYGYLAALNIAIFSRISLCLTEKKKQQTAPRNISHSFRLNTILCVRKKQRHILRRTYFNKNYFCLSSDMEEKLSECEAKFFARMSFIIFCE